MNLFEKNMRALIREIVDRNNFFLIDIEVKGPPDKKLFEIYIDGEKNITADDCAKLSGEINSSIQADISFDETDYRLNVSSPGVDRPLKYLKQYPKNLGRNFEVSFKDGEEIKKITGKLINIENENLIFRFNDSEVAINFNHILKAKVLISFN
jgi:ribosome maturation factor RimP